MKTALITGASTGIGKALAYTFASRGFNLILVARRKALLDEIAKDIRARYKTEVLVHEADLTQKKAVVALYEESKKRTIDVLINNAGFGDFSYPWDVDLDKAERMLDLNVKALTELSLRYVADYRDKEATLINVSSIGGYSIFSSAALYCATKFFVASFTEGISNALHEQGKKMRAKVLAPSATSSEFATRASEDAALNGEEIVSSMEFISAEQLAEYAYALYESDKCVGIVNAANELELKDPIYPAV